jgi:hypothetical protein
MRRIESEFYAAEAFRLLGYRTDAVGPFHDEGVRVIAEREGGAHFIFTAKP